MSTYPVYKVTNRSTAQAIFTAINKHLQKQGGRAYDIIHKGCVNRTPDGKACAVACLWSDAEQFLTKGFSFAALIWHPDSPEFITRFRRFNILLMDCQYAHDGSSGSVTNVNERFLAVAVKHDLKWIPLTSWNG